MSEKISIQNFHVQHEVLVGNFGSTSNFEIFNSY